MKVSDEEIISALLSCVTNRQAAEKCGLSETQLYTRMRKDDFKIKYQQAKDRLLEQTTSLVQNHMTEAVVTLVKVMRSTSSSPQVKVNAAEAVIRNGLKLKEQYEIVARLEALERGVRHQ